MFRLNRPDEPRRSAAASRAISVINRTGTEAVIFSTGAGPKFGDMREQFLTPMVAMSLLTGLMSANVGGIEAPATQPAVLRGVSLRVMTFNIHHAEGTDGRCDVDRIAALIRAQDPDLVAVQEVDVKTDRVGQVDVAAELARQTSMHGIFGKAMDYRGGEYGQVILSRFPIDNFQTHPLPGVADREPRVAVAAEIALGADQPTIRFISAHLDSASSDVDRVAQAKTLIALFGQPDNSVTILAGDFNATAGSKTLEIIGERFANASAGDDLEPTSPSVAPKRKIDWIMLRTPHPWRVKRSVVVGDSVASDHRPLLVDIESQDEAPASPSMQLMER